MSKLDLEKAEEPEIKLPTSVGSQKKAREFQKNIYFCFIDYTKVFDCVDHNKLENSSRDGNTAAAAAAKSLQSCPTPRDPMDCSLPGSPIHGIFQARVLEWARLPYLPPEKPVCRSRSNSWNWTWNYGLIPNWERSTCKEKYQ